MKKYQYQLVRYIHDRVTAEFVNVGVIIFDPDSHKIKSQFIGKYGRVSQFFNEINGHYLITTLKQIEKNLNILSKQIDTISNSQNISDLTNIVLTKDDSALVCSEILFGIDINIDSALTDIFERFVNKYSNETELHNDKYVWKNIYKKYFDKYEITKLLSSHSVKTSNDIIQFDKSWKNGVWHCYQTLSFDLKRVDSIKNKVYKWSGILNELENSNEELHIHFLTENSNKHKSIQKFIDDTLTNRYSKSLKVSLINETEAEQFVINVNKEIIEHNSKVN